MQKIVPHLWFDKEAKEASVFYTSLFPDSKITNISTIKDTPSGDCDMVSFNLSGQDFMAISAGPVFKINPSISMFVIFDNENEIEEVWNKLKPDGKVLMEYDSYPWAHKYGWIQDKYGLSWQLSWSDLHKFEQKITPMMMFTNESAGKTKDAIEFYTKIFPDSGIEMVVPYDKDDGEKAGFVKHSRFRLSGQNFMAMDSSFSHKFGFNEAVSFIVKCSNQKEIDYYWEKLSAVPESEQCGWLKDKFGISWQIVPDTMEELLTDGSDIQKKRVTEAFLKMKKFDIKELKKVYYDSLGSSEH